MTEEFMFLDLALIEPSRTQPRKTFDAAKLQELATSIKAIGLHQPVVVRPLPASRVADTSIDPATGKPRKVRPAYELVCGERRYRASLLAGMDVIAALTRDLTDDQVMEIQIVENLQRDDLSELEEAEGYEQLMKHSGLTADQVGEKIGKSRAYVYARLKLIDLGQDGRTALREGKLDFSRALLVARIPDSKLQAKAVKEIVQGGEYAYSSNEPMSYRRAAEYVQQNYMLKLNTAKFKIASADLVPEAGACTACPKRTGQDPDLFSDVKSADVCIDPVCFHKKEDAHAAAQVAAAKAKGQTVIAGKAAQELKPEGHGSYSDKVVGYRRLDSVEDSPTSEPLRKLIGALMKSEGIKPVLIESGRNKGEFLECLPNEVALKLLKKAESQAVTEKGATKEVQKLVDDKKAKAEAKLKTKYERDWRNNLVHDTWCEIRDDADIKAFNIDVHRFLAVRTARNLSTDDRDAVCQILKVGKVGASSGLVDYIKDCPSPESVHLLMLMQSAAGPDHMTYGEKGEYVENEALMLVAGNVFGKQLDSVIKEIQGEVKAEIWPKVAPKAKPATGSAARPKEGPGGSKDKGSAPKKPPARAAKLSAEEATQGIAAAMQGLEGSASANAVAPPAEPVGVLAVGSAVQITSDTDKLQIRLHKYAGKKGTITAKTGPESWDVSFKGRTGGLAGFHATELEAVAA